MRDFLIKKATSPFTALIAIPILFILVVAMKYPHHKKTYTYLALGDSYTIGEKVASEENFPSQVVQLLRHQKLDFAIPEIVAKTGWTTDELQAGIKNVSLKKKYDFVSLLIGVNNQYRGKTVADYILEFEVLLQKAISLAGDKAERVIVLSIPDWGVTPFAYGSNTKKIASEIDAFNKANKEIADKYHVHYVDITPGTRKAETDLSLLAEDELHPSAKEYKKWAVKVAEIIKNEK
jgi:lysophospholipase L1-like esterase